MKSWTRLILLLLMIRSSAAEEEKKNLKGTKGGNITLPDPLMERGFLICKGKYIAEVYNGKLYTDEETYTKRLRWNKTSGLFTLTDLLQNDSGNFIIISKKGNMFTASYSLTVYDSVAPPAVQTLSVSSDSCYLLCAVDKAAEITLWWYKDQEVVNQSSSAGSLPLTVTKQDLSSSYRCVAGNPAENKTLLVDLQKVCRRINPNSSSENNQRHVGIIIGFSVGCAGLLLALAAFLIWRKHFRTNTPTPDGRGSLQYAAVNTNPGGQNQGGTSQDVLITEAVGSSHDRSRL